ncbi:MAG: phosphate ABC transporter permease PstA [Chloroflexi bacterium]|nr:phosphate ABC transporter permease PstA [Chloroflexota bacterium]
MSARLTQKLAVVCIWATGATTVLALLVIIGYTMYRGLPHIGWSFLTTAPKGGTSGAGGISTVIVSTLYLVGLTLLILVPLGVGAAVYLAEYAPDNRLTRFIRFGTEVLAGVPSIVFGMFGFAFLVIALHFHFSILSGALTLVCLLLPTLIRTSEEAIKAVPRSYREAALALGATKWQTTWRVTLPAAISGIATGVILCIGRAVGETAALYVTMGGTTALPTSLLSSGRTLALHVFYLATVTNNLDGAFATGVILIIVIVVANSITNWLSQRFRARMAGGT